MRSRIDLGLFLCALALFAVACDSTSPDDGDRYADVVMEDSPIGYWRLEERSGVTFSDASGFGHAGTVIDTPELGVVVGDQLGAGIRVDGSPDGITVPHGEWMNVTTVTVEAWVRPDAPAGSQYGSVVEKGYQWNLYINLDGRPGFGLPFQAGHAEGDEPLTVGQLYHLVGTYEPGVIQNGATTRGVMRIFVNGVLAGVHTNAQPKLALTSNAFYIGKGPVPQFEAEGAIDEVAIYDRILSLERIQAHYEAGR
jgi:hypothetical protein